MLPTKEQALQFAIMLKAGLPASTAIQYFIVSEDPSEMAKILEKWTHSRTVADATLALLGKPWQEMSLDEQCKTALDYTYAGMAFFLFNTNYSEMASSDKAKADTARGALEAKLAGMAGKGDALTRFLDDFVAGKLKNSAGATLKAH